VNDALAVAHTGPIAVRDAQLALEESGARVRLRLLIDETLDEVRTSSRDRSLRPSAGALLRSLADAVERRVP
jgi:geranylgeranyl diphosphate synthase type II